MNRIEEKLNHLRDKDQKALITYMTAGLPDMEGCEEIIRVQEQAGTDIIELGIPFSDPVADGPVIQEASYQSIQKGTNLAKVFDMTKRLRKSCEIPLVFMMYYNTILYYGIEAFVKECVQAGIDGLIIPDLPLEEQEELMSALKTEPQAPIFIQLVSPVSGERIPQILKGARGFVYCVSSMGVTGQAGDFHKDVKPYLEKVKKESGIPVMMGFGIRTAMDVEPVKDMIDGAIVGSHFIRLMEGSQYSLKEISEYIRRFKRELNN